MRVLLLSTSYNSLTQHAHVELVRLGHDVSIELFISDDQVRKGIELYQPDLILCPMLTKVIPPDVWRKTPCIIIHPGVRGDRGPSSLDWAILNQEPVWGVTAVQAAVEMDSGPIWASFQFPMRPASKSSLYRDEATQAAIKVIRTVVKRFESGVFVPEPLDYSRFDVQGCCRPMMKQSRRAIDWSEDPVELILRKIRSADSTPGVLDTIDGDEYYLYGAHKEGTLVGKPGEILATRHGAICRAAIDGAVWISHLKKKGAREEVHFKLPATMVLGSRLDKVPELPIEPLYTSPVATFKEIWYEEVNDVGYLYFEFYNGAMSSSQCERLTEAFHQACARPTKVIVLMGGRDFWSNGIHLNVIEAAPNPANESWRNINLIDDLVESILTAQGRLVISAMHGSAGAGGMMLALAADLVFVREGTILNPHYRTMGGLYGSEFWTYTLPKRVGAARAEQLTQACQPIGAEEAKEIGLVDEVIYLDEYSSSTFKQQISRIAERLVHDRNYDRLLADKVEKLNQHDQEKNLLSYRKEELMRMRDNFFGEDNSYHVARKNFVLKVPPVHTPLHLARHRQPSEPIWSSTVANVGVLSSDYAD